MSSIRELDEREFEFRNSTDEVLDYWHTIRVTNTHSDKKRAHALDFFINNDREREDLLESATDYLEVHEDTTERWLEEFRNKGLLEEEGAHYDPTLVGRVMEEGLKRYSAWLAENHPVTDEELKEAALDGIFDRWHIRIDASEVDNDEFIQKWKATETLHGNVGGTVDTRDAYDEAIRVMNELEGDRMEILGLFLQRPEEEAMQAVEEGNYCIKTGQGAKTYINRIMEEREIVDQTDEGYQLNDKGKKAIETLKFQSQMLEYGRQAEGIGRFVNNLENGDLVSEYRDNLVEA